MSADSRPFHSIIRTLVRGTLLVGVLCALIVTMAQGWYDYRDAQLAFRAEVDEIAQSHVPMLKVALWDIEINAVQEQLARIANRPQIAWTRLSTATGQQFEAGRHPPHGNGDATLLIPHPYGGQALGTLTLAYDRAALVQQTLREIVQTVSSLLLLTLFVCLLQIALLRHELQKPLARIAEFCTRLSPSHLAVRLDLKRRPRRVRDEIDLVADGFDTLHAGIERYVAERDRAMAALAQQRDRLDQTVTERTADLTRLNLFLETLSQLSMRFIQLPPDDYPDALRQTLSMLTRYLNISGCALAERDQDGMYRWAFVYPPSAHDVTEPAEGAPLHPLPPISHHGWHVSRWSKPPHDVEVADFMHYYGASALALYRHESEHSGHLLACFAKYPCDWADAGQRQMKLAADMLFSTLERWRDLKALDLTRRELWRLSRSDPLTGLPNRRRFDELKLDETRRALRTGSALAVLMVDVDWFKRYNDGYGHAAGDDCLIAVAHVMQAAFQRTGELVARTGGEEFIVLLPGSGFDAAVAAAEHLRLAVRDLNIPHQDSPMDRVTLSIGVAVLEHENRAELRAESVFAQLLHRADEALYVAKANGRDRVAALPLPPIEPEPTRNDPSRSGPQA